MSNGQPLTATGAGKAKLSGTHASCVSCHRRSGLGGVEGDQTIPPIAGKVLFGGAEPVTIQIDKRFNKGFSSQSRSYNDMTFSEAVRLGKHISGRKLSDLMPRYDLSSDQLKALASYLRTLSVSWSPGVDENDIHLATVITPNVSHERRKIFLDTLTAMVNQHNVNVVSGQRQRISPIERRMHNRRHWKIHVLELTGLASTWGGQLKKWQQQNPVFAILSGLSQDEWQPVQDFCENNQVPCWFPVVDVVPDNAEKETYSFYFSGGVQLEAKVIAHQVLLAEKKPQKIVQLVGQNAISQNAAKALHQLFGKSGIEVQDIEWSQQNKQQVTEALKKLHAHDVLVGWLKNDELNALVTGVSAPLAQFYLSFTLTGEQVPAWTKEWGNNTWLVQRLELPKMRAVNLSRFKDWLKYRQLPLVDEKMQSEIYFAVNSFSWMVSSMLNNFYTDYLIDRAEATLSMRETMQVQEEIQTMMMGGGGRRLKAAKNLSEALPAASISPSR